MPVPVAMTVAVAVLTGVVPMVMVMVVMLMILLAVRSLPLALPQSLLQGRVDPLLLFARLLRSPRLALRLGLAAQLVSLQRLIYLLSVPLGLTLLCLSALWNESAQMHDFN
jgi:hypothetical protein